MTSKLGVLINHVNHSNQIEKMKVKNINFFIELDRFSIFMFKIDPIQIEKNVLCMVMYLKIRVLDIYCLFFF